MNLQHPQKWASGSEALSGLSDPVAVYTTCFKFQIFFA